MRAVGEIMCECGIRVNEELPSSVRFIESVVNRRRRSCRRIGPHLDGKHDPCSSEVASKWQEHLDRHSHLIDLIYTSDRNVDN